MEIRLRVPQRIPLKPAPGTFYNIAVGLYLLHMAVMATLTNFYPDVLMRFRMPSFLLVAGLVLVAIALRLLKKGVPLRPLLFYCAFFALMLLGIVYQAENTPYILDILLSASFIKHVLLFSMLFLFEEEPDLRVRQLTVIAVAALLVYYLGVSKDMFLMENGRIDYMLVGYGCSPWWCILAQGVFYYRNKIAKLFCLAGTIYFAIFITVYGNRGALVVLFIAVAVIVAVYLPLKLLVPLGSLLFAAMVALLLFLEPILTTIGKLLGLDLTQSRNLRLLTSDFLGLGYDSGRMPLYQECLGAIFRHPLLGNGVGGDRVATGGEYVHNIVLELCTHFGIVIGALIYGWLLYMGVRMLSHCKNRDWRALFLPFYVFSMVQLFFSRTLYQSGYLMTSVVIYLTYSESLNVSRSRQRKIPRTYEIERLPFF